MQVQNIVMNAKLESQSRLNQKNTASKIASSGANGLGTDVSFKGIDWFFVAYVVCATKFTEIMTRRMLIRHTLTNFKDNPVVSNKLVDFFHSVKLPISRTQYLPAKRIEKFKKIGIISPNYVPKKPPSAK